MPRERQPELGVKSPYTARYGMNIVGCTGLELGLDPSMIPHTALRQAINVRVHDGVVLSRYGQTEEESGMDGCIQGLIDIDGVGSRAVFATNERVSNTIAGIQTWDENLRASPADDTNVFTIDGDPFLEHPWQADQSAGNLEDSRPRIVYTWWDGTIIFQDASGENNNEMFKLVLPEEGVAPGDLNREEVFPMVIPGETSPVTVTSFATLPQIGNVDGPLPLYMGTLAGGVVAYVQGQLVRLLSDGTFSGRVTLFMYNNRVYACGDDEVWYQDGGWTDGGQGTSTSWTSLTMPGGIGDFRPMAAIEGYGFGWIGGFDANGFTGGNSDWGFILKVDDSSSPPTISVAVSGIGGGDYLWSVDDFVRGPDGNLYAAYRSGTAASFFGSFGLFTGTALSTIAGWGESEAMCYRLASSSRKLYALGYGSDEDAKVKAWTPTGGVETITVWDDGDPSPFDMVIF